MNRSNYGTTQATLPLKSFRKINPLGVNSDNSPSLERLAALFTLGSINGFGPGKFKLVHQNGMSPESILDDPNLLPVSGKVGEKLRVQLKSLSKDTYRKCEERASKQLEDAQKISAFILTFESQFYPKSLYLSSYSLPVLYVRGNPDILNRQAIAVVGSRKIRKPYTERAQDFVEIACGLHQVISSGFAIGADSIGHRTAFHNQGATICVMPCGLNRLFPPENKELWMSLLDYKNAAFVSEFAFGAGANSLNLRKRNKLIVALTKGVLIAQSAKTGGAMNAYRFGLELKKSIATFEDDDSEDTSGNLEIKNSNNAQIFAANHTNQESLERWIQSL